MELKLNHVSVSYGRRQILRELDLTVRGGEILAVLGENGSGKTTLLRAIAGNVPLREGSVLWDGQDLAACGIRKRASLVATMSQELTAEPGLCGMDRIEMGFFPEKGLFGRLSAAEREEIREMAHAFGIGHLLARDLASMSAGERQMIFLCGAAVRKTPVLLLDEPSSALDFNRTERLFSLLHRLAGEGRVILTVLHDPTLALRHATAILPMRGGQAERIELRDTADERIEQTLRTLYPGLRIHRDPLFCYTETQMMK
ncbi:MAG: ABC transporter ATP-binding protein [Clostridia bacterium]|nr:ABC transporter ATP-binding protein [Clostridia bacterium]